MLSSCEHWTPTDGSFDATKFYNNIVQLFEADADDPWVKETLEFWNKYVLFFYFSSLHTLTCICQSCAKSSQQRQELVSSTFEQQ